MKENFFKIITLILIIIFCGGLFFTIRFFKKEIGMVTGPSKDVLKTNSSEFDNATYQAVMKKLNGQ